LSLILASYKVGVITDRYQPKFTGQLPVQTSHIPNSPKCFQLTKHVDKCTSTTSPVCIHSMLPVQRRHKN